MRVFIPGCLRPRIREGGEDQGLRKEGFNAMKKEHGPKKKVRPGSRHLWERVAYLTIKKRGRGGGGETRRK